MTRRFTSIALLALAGTLLTACDQEDEVANSDADGEVLKGSISDRMPPYYQMRSQPPREEAGAVATDGEGDSEAVAGSDDAEAGQASTAETAETTAPAPEPAADEPTDALDAIGE